MSKGVVSLKHIKSLTLIICLLLTLTACNAEPEQQTAEAVKIQLSDQSVQVDGTPAGTDKSSAVYTANDIVYYEAGKDFTYGEGTEEDAHSPEEAAAHTVVHITKAGTYSISGKLSKGQIAVDLGKDAKEDPKAVVTLMLNSVDITCEVAPAVIFYNVYECGDTDNPTKYVDTAAAGANVVIADGSENAVNGAYVARVYKPDSVVLSEDGTKVEDAKKLHKYDGAFYSKMSMNINGGKKNTGILNIRAQNEGLDTEMHLTVNGGNINILSGNDGINTNEDGVSVTTVNGGALNIKVTGETGEGDGIDSNGWLVINDGTVIAAACSHSGDAGIDSDMGIHINGGTVIASGSMLDRVEDGGQTYAVFTFAQKQSGTDTIYLKDKDGKAVLEHCPQNAYSILIFSSSALKEGTYALWSGQQQLANQSGGGFGGPGMRPGGMQFPEGMTPPEGFEDKKPQEGGPSFGEMTPPDGFTPPAGQESPEGQTRPEKPGEPNDGNWKPNGNGGESQERTVEFKISNGANMFSGISPLA
jgi:hypothetical protein